MNFVSTAHAIRTGPVRNQLICLAVFLLVVALCPLVMNDYWLRLMVFVFVNIGLASSWNLIGGFGGYASFGHGVFFGVGAFAGAVGMVRYGLPLPAVMVIGGALAAALAAMFVPVFKQKGLYFALSTLAVMLVFETVLQRWTFTRGLRSYDLGWTLAPSLPLEGFFYLFLGLLGLIVASIIVVVRSKIGYALHAIRKDEVLAASIGVRTTKYKTLAFMISAAWPGVLGAAFAPFLAYVSVQSVFDVSITLNMILITIFGGAGTVIGPIVGGIALSVIDQIAWGNFLEYHRLIYGALIVAITTLHPGGLASVFWGWVERRRSAAKPVPRPSAPQPSAPKSSANVRA